MQQDDSTLYITEQAGIHRSPLNIYIFSVGDFDLFQIYMETLRDFQYGASIMLKYCLTS